jgi:2-polyprenyl-6-hydroxyphenyl methylase/3-demethylubiquinone-9 3-methyltransferase
MDDVDVLDVKDRIAWWRDPCAESAHAKYLRMHSSDTNRSKIAITERLLDGFDWDGRRVLEYGCGGGYFTVWMAKRGARVHATDMNPNAIAAARFFADKEGLGDRVHIDLANADTDAVDGIYDFVFAKDVVEHLDDDRAFFRRVGTQLTPGGGVYIATQNDHCLNYLIEGSYERFVRGNRQWFGWDKTHRRFYNAPLLTRRLREAGIEPVRWGSSYLFPWRFITKRLTGTQRPWRGWTVLDQGLGTMRPFSRWGWSIAVIGRKAAARTVTS